MRGHHGELELECRGSKWTLKFQELDDLICILCCENCYLLRSSIPRICHILYNCRDQQLHKAGYEALIPCQRQACLSISETNSD